MEFFDRLFEPQEEDAARANWPAVTGVIYSASVRLPSRNIHMVEIGYSYAAGSEYYSGYFQRVFVFEDTADDFAALFPRGRKILVHYHPNKPDVSTVFKQDMDVKS